MRCLHCGSEDLDVVGTDHLGQAVAVCQNCGRHYRTDEGPAAGERLEPLDDAAFEDG